jgi:Arc/MetJ family transcription regulator
MATRTRTNIELDDESLRVVMQRYGLTTKTEAVDMALRHLAGQPMTQDEALAMEGANAIESIPEEQTPSEPS